MVGHAHVIWTCFEASEWKARVFLPSLLSHVGRLEAARVLRPHSVGWAYSGGCRQDLRERGEGDASLGRQTGAQADARGGHAARARHIVLLRVHFSPS